jgi:hypothetical protein
MSGRQIHPPQAKIGNGFQLQILTHNTSNKQPELFNTEITRFDAHQMLA